MTGDQPKMVVGLGEILWDCFSDSRRPGGAPANLAVHATQLGLQGVVLSRVGADSEGDDLLAKLTAHGVAGETVQRDPDHPTGMVTVDDTRPDDPRYHIHEDAAWDWMQWTPQWESIATSASAICFGTLAQRKSRSRETIHQCLKSAGDALRVYDVNLRQSYYTPARVRGSFQLANVVKLNHDEATILAALLEMAPTDESSFVTRVIQEFEIDVVCVTQGKEGCHLYADSRFEKVSATPVSVADAVGAGDAFTAAFVYGRLAEMDLALCGNFANRVGGLVASHRGAMPKLREEYAALIQEFQG